MELHIHSKIMRYYIYIAILMATSILSVGSCSKENLPDLVLYYFPECPYCEQVLAYLRTSSNIELVSKISLRNINLSEAALDELRVYGGKEEVPCLLVKQQPIYDSQRIIQWLKSYENSLSQSLIPSLN